MSNDLDDRFVDELRQQLHATADQWTPPAHLEANVRLRERTRRHRAVLAQAAGSVVLVGSLVAGVAVLNRSDSGPAISGSGPGPFSTADAIYPVLDDQTLPPGLVELIRRGIDAAADGPPMWSGVVAGAPEPKNSSDLIVVQVWNMPASIQIPDAAPRRADVFEETRDDLHILFFSRNGLDVNLIGHDLNLMYEVVDLIAPVNRDGAPAGYSLVHSDGASVVEVVLPSEVSSSEPSLNVDGSTVPLSITVSARPALFALAECPVVVPLVEAQQMYECRAAADTIIMPLDSTHTLLVSSEQSIDHQSLVQIANGVRFTNSDSWAATYPLMDPPIQPPSGA